MARLINLRNLFKDNSTPSDYYNRKEYTKFLLQLAIAERLEVIATILEEMLKDKR